MLSVLSFVVFYGDPARRKIIELLSTQATRRARSSGSVAMLEGAMLQGALIE